MDSLSPKSTGRDSPRPEHQTGEAPLTARASGTRTGGNPARSTNPGRAALRGRPGPRGNGPWEGGAALRGRPGPRGQGQGQTRAGAATRGGAARHGQPGPRGHGQGQLRNGAATWEGSGPMSSASVLLCAFHASAVRGLVTPGPAGGAALLASPPPAHRLCACSSASPPSRVARRGDFGKCGPLFLSK